jgi:hypothetical protein
VFGFEKLAHRLRGVLNFRDPPNVPHYGWSYFDHLVAVYATLNTADHRADAVIEKSRVQPEHLTWGDIFLLENINFSLMTPDLVDRSAWILRERFREIACPTVFEKYLSSVVPKERGTLDQLSLLRADLARLLDVLHWHYSLIPTRERIRKSLTIKCILRVLVYTILLGLLLIACRRYNADFIASTACVIYFGIIGGFVSSQRRMESIPSDGDPLISVFGLDNAGYYLWLSPLLGAVFAVVLALMFIGGVLKGVVFPDFYMPPVPVKEAPFAFFDFTWITLPKTGADYGKLFIWSFVAGFAERLVPDSLDRLAAKLNPKNAQPSAVGTAPVNAQATQDAKPQDIPVLPEPRKAMTPETLQNVLHTGELHVDQNSDKQGS